MSKLVHVLIVDDVSEMRDLLSRVVEQLSLGFLEAETGAEAIKILEENELIKIVLLDIGLDDIDGYRVAKSMKSIRPSLKICFITGRSEFDDIRKAGKVGVDGYLVKPIKPSLVSERIKELLVTI